MNLFLFFICWSECIQNLDDLKDISIVFVCTDQSDYICDLQYCFVGFPVETQSLSYRTDLRFLYAKFTQLNFRLDQHWPNLECDFVIKSFFALNKDPSYPLTEKRYLMDHFIARNKRKNFGQNVVRFCKFFKRCLFHLLMLFFFDLIHLYSI